MHEATVAQSILSIACARLNQTPHAKTVLAIHVIIGEFRNVELDSLQFAFDNLKGFCEDTSGCRLEAEVVHTKAICRGGGHTYRPNFDSAFRCPTCGEGIGRLVCGEELDVIGITLQADVDEERAEYARVSG